MRYGKRILSAILVLVLTMTMIPTNIIALENTINSFDAWDAKTNPLDAVEYGVTGVDATSEKITNTAWVLTQSQIPNSSNASVKDKYRNNIYFKMQSDFTAKVAAAGGKATVTVTYWDGFSEGKNGGFFGMTYNCITKDNKSYANAGICNLTGENRWKTFDFVLTDAVLGTGVDGKSFKLEIASSPSDVYISRVQVTCGSDTAYVLLNTANYDRTHGFAEVMYRGGSAYNAGGVVNLDHYGWLVNCGSEYRNGWSIKNSNFDVKFDMTGEFVANQAGRPVNISVVYWDGFSDNATSGLLGLQYWVANSTHRGVTINLNGSQMWKEQTWTLTDADLSWNGSSNDNWGQAMGFRVYSWGSASTVYVHKIAISYEAADGTLYKSEKVLNTTGRDGGAVSTKTPSGGTPIGILGIKSIGGGTNTLTNKGSSMDKNALWFYVDENAREEMSQNVAVEIDYLDKGNGFFALTYDNGDADRKSNASENCVRFEDSGVWKTHTFYLSDAKLENWGNIAQGTDGYGRSFGLVSYLEDGTQSEDSIYISRVSLSKSAYSVAVTAPEKITYGEDVTVTIMPDHEIAGFKWNTVDMSLTYDQSKLSLQTTSLGESFELDHDAQLGTIRITGNGADKACGTEGIQLQFKGKAVGEAAVTITKAVIGGTKDAATVEPIAARITKASAAIQVAGYPVTLGTGLAGEAEADPAKDYTFSTDDSHYTYSFTLNGAAFTPVDNGDGTYTISKDNISNPMVIDCAGREARVYQVTLKGNAQSDITAELNVTYLTAYSFTVEKRNGLDYDVSVSVGGEQVEPVITDNTYTIAAEKVVGDIVITVLRTVNCTVSTTVAPYFVASGDTQVHLVVAKVTGDTVSGFAPAVSGKPMFYSEKYAGYCYLIIANESADVIKETIDSQIDWVETNATGICYNGDVNMTGEVSINDAQLIYDIYSGSYLDFTTISMQSFLSADVDGNGTVDLEDAFAAIG